MEKVTIEQLAQKVREMRAAQNKYFSTRSNGALTESKRLEKQVDEMVSRIEAPPPGAEQTSMFR